MNVHHPLSLGYRLVLVIMAVVTVASSAPCGVAPSIVNSVQSINTGTQDTVTYTCNPGKLFSDGAPHKMFICDEVTDWTEVSSLACNGKYFMI